MGDIRQKTEMLAEAILESEEYQELKTISDKVTSDQEAHAILKEYDQQQQKLHQAHHQGRKISEEEQAKMESLQQKMEENPKLHQLLKAQEQFNDLMDSVFRVINNAIEGVTSCCGDDCGGDCG